MNDVLALLELVVRQQDAILTLLERLESKPQVMVIGSSNIFGAAFGETTVAKAEMITYPTPQSFSITLPPPPATKTTVERDEFGEIISTTTEPIPPQKEITSDKAD